MSELNDSCTCNLTGGPASCALHNRTGDTTELEQKIEHLTYSMNAAAGELINGRSPKFIAECLLKDLDQTVFEKDFSLEEEIDKLESKLAVAVEALEQIVAPLSTHSSLSEYDDRNRRQTIARNALKEIEK